MMTPSRVSARPMRTCASAGIMGSPLASTASNGLVADALAPRSSPSVRLRPMTVSCTGRSSRSQRSISMRIRRRTRTVPPTAQSGPSSAHTTVANSGVPACGKCVPSTWPIKLRLAATPMVPGADDRKPGCCQRTRVSVDRSLVSKRSVWLSATGSLAPTCRSRSVSAQPSSMLSVGNDGICGNQSGT